MSKLGLEHWLLPMLKNIQRQSFLPTVCSYRQYVQKPMASRRQSISSSKAGSDLWHVANRHNSLSKQPPSTPQSILSAKNPPWTHNQNVRHVHGKPDKFVHLAFTKTLPNRWVRRERETERDRTLYLPPFVAASASPAAGAADSGGLPQKSRLAITSSPVSSSYA